MNVVLTCSEMIGFVGFSENVSSSDFTLTFEFTPPELVEGHSKSPYALQPTMI